MKLNRVNIKNFRSIEDIIIQFEPTCRILVGVNESGKSNILKALTLLNTENKPIKASDLRDALPDEEPITKSVVQFVFRLEKEESDQVFEYVLSRVLCTSKNPVVATLKGKNINLTTFCNIHNEGLYTANILNERKLYQHWALSKSYETVPGWKKPSEICPLDFMVKTKGESFVVSKFKLLWHPDFIEIPNEYLEDVTVDDIHDIVGEKIIEIVKANKPATVFWTYDERNLLPDTISMEDFYNNPEICVPLKNMFSLAGIKNIKTSIEEAKKGTDNQFQNYLNRISKKTTTHFREVWKEYKNIEFSLRQSSGHIIPGIKEKNTHDFSRRSDGFKRFVTFLLLISVDVETNIMENTLLLVDEPEISLHPSGARYLRDELVKIGKTNYVVYSTHSIFMIDSSDVSRHYIVKKKDEVTTIETAVNSNIADEEVLYNALGYSIFETLKENNLIFEGWNDKRLFQIALDNASAKIKKKFKDVTPCYAKGVKSIRAITPLIELANRKCLIISDSDTPAKDQQKIYQKDKGFGEWKTYQEIDSSLAVVTGEDFIKKEFIAKQVNNILSSQNMPLFTSSVLPESGRVTAISKWLINNGMTNDQAKDNLAQIKNSIFDSLKASQIEESYSKLLENISF